MLLIWTMFEFWDFGVWASDSSFRSMDFGFEFSFLDFGFHALDLRFVKIDVGYCP